MPASKSAEVRIVVDGDAMLVESGISVAAVLLNAERTAFRRSVSGEPRGPLCGMGTCQECRVTIDGVDHQRACMTTVRDQMVVNVSRGSRE